MFVSRFIPPVLLAPVLMALAMSAIPAWAPAQTTPAPTTSDLLEKAVYAEETTGDLGEAIELYGQVIAQSKVANRVGAEAQYRLGLCLEKQGDKKKADEAYQAVVDNFPQEAEFVTLAKEHLPGPLELLPVPWPNVQQLHLTMKLLSGKEIGTEVCSIHTTELDGKPVWRCSNRVFVTLNGANSFSEVFCDKETFAPLQSYWIHSMLGKADAKYDGAKATIDIAGRKDPLVLDFTNPVFNKSHGYDNEQGIQVFRRLPLEVGLHSELPIIATLMGNLIPLEYDVEKKEKITTAAGTFNCYKMVLNIGQTFWISDDANRYLVRFEAGGVVADLTRIEHRPFEESVEWDDDQVHFTLPSGWFAYVAGDDADDGDHDVYLLDPRAIAKGKLKVDARDPQDEDQATPQAWAEASLKKIRRKAKGFKIRGEGVRTFAFDSQGSQEAAQVVFDFKEKKVPMTGYAVALFSEKSVATVQFILPTDQFESQRGDYDALIRSLRLK